MTLALFRAEFLRALPVLPWLLGLHILMFGLRTFWRDEFSSRLTGVVEWTTWTVALVLLVGSLWQDSPARADRFTASRPMRLPELLFSKIAALMVIVALPFLAVEWGTLVWWEQSADIVGSGTFQTAVFAVIAVLAAFPFIWFWRDATTALTGAAVAFLTGAVFLRGWGENPLNANGPRWLGLNHLMTAPVLFTAVAVAGLLSAVLLAGIPRRGHPLTAIPCFATVVCLALGTSLWLRVRHVAAGEAEGATLVSLRYTPLQQADGYATRLEIAPPSGPEDPEIERTRAFTKVLANGKDALRWSDLRYGKSVNDLLSPAVRAALRRRYGGHLDLPSSPGEPVEPAMATIDDRYPPPEPLAFDVQIRETGVRWQVVAELPLVQGATARHRDSHWTVKQATGIPAAPVRSMRQVSLSEQFPKLWLGNVLQPPSSDPWDDRFFLVDPASGQVLPAWAQQMPSGLTARTTLQRRTIRVSIHENSWRSDEPPEIDWSRDYRLVIVRAEPAETRHFDWISPGPVAYPSRRLEVPFIPSLNSLPTVDPELRTAADAARFARCGLGSLAEELLLGDPMEAGLSEEEWIAWFRLHPTAKTFRALNDRVVPRTILEKEVDGWLAGYQVTLPNPHVDSTLELALARGEARAPGWLKEAILRKRAVEPGFSAVWVDDPVRESFTLPDGMGKPDEIVGWFLEQDPSRFAFDAASGKYQLR